MLWDALQLDSRCAARIGAQAVLAHSLVGGPLPPEADAHGRSAAYRVDQLRGVDVTFCSNHLRVKAANLAALWDRFGAAGADHVVVNGPIASEDVVQAYRAVLPHADVMICRLVADEASLRQRVFERRLGEGPPLAGDNLVGQPDDVLHSAVQQAARIDRLLNASGAFSLCSAGAAPTRAGLRWSPYLCRLADAAGGGEYLLHLL